MTAGGLVFRSPRGRASSYGGRPELIGLPARSMETEVMVVVARAEGPLTVVQVAGRLDERGVTADKTEVAEALERLTAAGKVKQDVRRRYAGRSRRSGEPWPD